MGRHTGVGVPLWLLENTRFAETFRVAMGKVGGSAGLQVGLGEQPGVGESHCRSGRQKQVGAAVVFALSGCLLSKVQAQSRLLSEAPASPHYQLLCGMFEEPGRAAGQRDGPWLGSGYVTGSCYLVESWSGTRHR